MYYLFFIPNKMIIYFKLPSNIVDLGNVIVLIDHRVVIYTTFQTNLWPVCVAY